MTQRMPSDEQGASIIQGTRRAKQPGVWDEDPAQGTLSSYRIARASLPVQEQRRRQQHPSQQGASLHYAGSSHTIHPEDQPYATDERGGLLSSRIPVRATSAIDEGLDDRPARTSARRYRHGSTRTTEQQTAPVARQRRPLHGADLVAVTLSVAHDQRGQRPDHQEHQPTGPTTGPMRPLIVVMETTGEDVQGDPRPDEGTLPPQQGDEQDRLPPVPEEEKQSTAAPAPPQEAPDGPEPTPPPREPRPLSLPVVAARAPRSFPLLVAGTLGISIILLGVALGILLATNPTSLGPMIAWLPGITPTASVTLTPAQESLQGEVRPSEQLASPAQCHPALHTDHPIGSEATRVTITLTVTCQAEVYDAQAVQQLASTALGEQAHKSLGAGYNVQGTIKTSVTQVATTEAAHGTLSLLVDTPHYLDWTHFAMFFLRRITILIH